MATEQTTEPAPALPPLSPSDFRAFNHMAEHMNYFHEHFRAQWKTLYAAASGTSSDEKLSDSRLISRGLQFLSQLEMHHGIEEAHIFPILGRRMDAFNAKSATGPLEQHRQIHKGMEELQAYLSACQSGTKTLKRDEVKTIMDGFAVVLWTHLDDEVKLLGAENMRKYWSKQEMAAMPM